MNLRESTLEKEGSYQASKWLETPFLIDVDEIEQLLLALDSPALYHLGSVVDSGQGELGKSTFLNKYKNYIESIKEGVVPLEPHFSLALTADNHALYRVTIKEGRQLIKISHPVIQITGHAFAYSPVDGKVRSNIQGENSISWGLQFAYPQLFMNPLTHQVEQVLRNKNYINSSVFLQFQKWMRKNSSPTPLITRNGKINVPIRLGKKCFTWINQHSHLIERGLKVNGL